MQVAKSNTIMGIRGLSKLLAGSINATQGITKVDSLDHYRGKIIAFDASLHIYQFMTAVKADARTDASGSPTAHLQGLLSRTARLLRAGIRPVFVFDGEPPSAKAAVLQKRNQARSTAMNTSRQYRLSKSDVEDAKRLLTLMGIPVVQAPSEAEAQCADMCRTGLVHGVSTEDMDTLAFGSPLVIRNLFAASSSAAGRGDISRSKPGITEYHAQPLMSGLGLVSHAQFIDMCILCGCDYCGTIPGIGPVKALERIRQHGNIEGVMGALLGSSKLTHEAMAGFTFQQARQLFLYPSVLPASEVSPQLVWPKIKEEEIVSFLVDQKSFNADRVRKLLALAKQGEGAQRQKVIDDFFTKPMFQSDSPSTWPTPPTAAAP